MDGSINAALVELLGQTEGAAALRALLDALRFSHGANQADLLRRLLACKGDHAAAGLARLLSELDSPARALLCGETSLLEPVARAGLKDADVSVRLSVIELLTEAAPPSCAYLLAGALSDCDPIVRGRSAEALLALVRQSRHAHSVLSRYVAPAVSQAMRNFSVHRDEKALHALILLGPACSTELLEHVGSPCNRLMGPLKLALNASACDEAAGFVMVCLQHRGLAAMAQSYIAQADWVKLAAVASAEHWLKISGIMNRLSEITSLRAVSDDLAGITELPAAQQASALRLALACGIDTQSRDALLASATTGEPALALAAAPYLLQRLPARAELVLMALHSRCNDVQAVAAACIFAGGADRNLTEHLLEVLPRLGESVRGVMRQYLAVEAFDRYWRSYRRLNPQVRGNAARALLKLDASVVDLLTSRLACNEPAQQLQAVQLVRQIGMAEKFENALCRLARGTDRTVRAAAAGALGGSRSFRARSTLAGCLDDPDGRVQANAVEALAQAGADPSAVRDKLASDHNRVRGNAVRWLIEAGDRQADMALAAMLTDGRVAHRISALWVVKTLGYAPAGQILDRLATADEDAKVRARAATILRVLDRTGPALPVGRSGG